MDDDFDEVAHDAEVGAKIDFKNVIPDEPLVPPAKRFRRIRELSFGIVALLFVLIGLINLAMILWILSR